MHNSMSIEALFHCEGLAAAGVLTRKWTLFLVKREDVALQVKHGRVGSTTAFSRTPIHIPFWAVSFHMLLEIIFALKCLLAYFTRYFLFMGLPGVFEEFSPSFCHKGASLLTYVTLVHLPVSLQTAGGGEVFATSFLGTLERGLTGMLALVDSQLLMLLKGLLTTFKTADVLFLLIFMFAFKMFLQV